jgi:acetone carboxylase gamma subunit
MSRRISPTLEVRQNAGRPEICCRNCGHALAPDGSSWKAQAALSTVPVAALPGASPSVHPEVVFRRFICPDCGTLLDSETALAGDPFLEDRVST